jgi:hypothetical protein
MNRIYWTGFSSSTRNQAIYEISAIINRHGFITDFRMFSDLSLSISIEVEERKIDALYAELGKYMHLNDFTLLNTNSVKERLILLSVNFSQATGDLVIEVPAVPG